MINRMKKAVKKAVKKITKTVTKKVASKLKEHGLFVLPVKVRVD